MFSFTSTRGLSFSRFLKDVFSSFLVLVTLLCLGATVVHAQEGAGNAYVTPSIFIDDIELNSVNFQSGESISGSFNVLNQDDETVSNLFYGVELLKIKDVTKDPFSRDNLEEVDSYVDDKKLSFLPRTEGEVAFGYELPPKMPTGQYVLRVFVKNPEMMPFAWGWKSLGYIEGESGPRLSVRSIQVITSEGSFGKHAGVPVEKGNAPSLKLSLYNPSEEIVEDAETHIVAHRKNSDGETVRDFKRDVEVAFESQKETTYSIELPVFDEPDVYWSEIELLRNGETVSFKDDFHWVVAGDYGRVIRAELDKSDYGAGETANLELVLAGRPDVHLSKDSQTVGELEVRTFIECEEGGRIGEESFKRSPDPETSNVFNLEIPVQEQGKKCHASIEVGKNGKVFNSMETGGITPEELVSEPGFEDFQQKPERPTSYLNVALFIVALTVIGLLLSFLYTRMFSE